MIGDPITEEVRALARLDLEGLRAEWSRRWGVAPTPRSVDLLRRNLAWRIQAEAYGGLDREIEAQLLKKGRVQAGPSLQPGMLLTREWQGVRHEVRVVESGVIYRGHHHDSLSSVARAITGVRWNGPRFFGLRQVGKAA